MQIDGRPVDVIQQGSGPDLLMVHSLLADRSSFEVVLPLLASRFRVTAPNLPGYGGSAALTPPVAMSDYADWLGKLMRTMRLPAATTVFGNGFGGFATVSLAIRHGGLFDRLIVADALPGFPPAGQTPLRGMASKVKAEGLGAVLDVAIKRMFPEPFIAAHPDVIEERKRALAKADPDAFHHACLALAELDLKPLLGGIRNRTLVMVGELDQTTPPAIARELAAGIPGAGYQEIPACGHCPQLQKPEDLVARIVAFALA